MGLRCCNPHQTLGTRLLLACMKSHTRFFWGIGVDHLVSLLYSLSTQCFRIVFLESSSIYYNLYCFSYICYNHHGYLACVTVMLICRVVFTAVAYVVSLLDTIMNTVDRSEITFWRFCKGRWNIPTIFMLSLCGGVVVFASCALIHTAKGPDPAFVRRKSGTTNDDYRGREFRMFNPKGTPARCLAPEY